MNMARSLHGIDLAGNELRRTPFPRGAAFRLLQYGKVRERQIKENATSRNTLKRLESRAPPPFSRA